MLRNVIPDEISIELETPGYIFQGLNQTQLSTFCHIMQ
jgi:hypothetical protein